MLTADKPFGSFDRPQKPFGFVCVNSVLNVFSVRQQLKIFQLIVRAVKVFVVNFHAFGDRANKSFPHGAVYGDLGVFSIFARAKANIMISRNVRFDRTSAAVASPRLAMFDVKRGSDAGAKKISHRAQRSTVSKHGFSGVNLLGSEQLSPRHTSNTRKIADFVKALIAADWFPNLHTVDIKPVYVGGQ